MQEVAAHARSSHARELVSCTSGLASTVNWSLRRFQTVTLCSVQEELVHEGSGPASVLDNGSPLCRFVG